MGTQMRVKGRLPLCLPPFCVFPRRGYVLHGNLIISVPSICQDLYQTQVQVGMESIKELRKHVSGVRIYDPVLPIRRRREKACPARLLLNSLRQALSGTLHKLPINCQLLGISKTKQKKSLTRHTADKQTEGQTDRRWSLATISSGTITTSFPFRCDFELEKSNLKMRPLPASEASNDTPASWSNLPRKDQLFVLAFCRVFDFMQVASFQTICYYQLKSFDSTIPEETISWQSGIASGSFSAAQIFTAIIWGRIADAEWGGRKRVLLIGLWGTALGCAGLAFSRSFTAVVLFRLLAGGANGTVGIIRTMISENIKERKHQSRAFLLLPASFMVASVIGPVIGSWLAEPVTTFPSLFSADSWLASFPFALPAIFSAASMMMIGLVVFLSIEETHSIRKDYYDLGLHCASIIKRIFRRGSTPSHEDYSALGNDDQDSDDEDIELPEIKAPMTLLHPSAKPKPSFRTIWTYNVVTTLLAQAIFDFHMGAFGNLLPLFLSSPRRSVERYLPFIFNGGLGMAPRSVGLALAILGSIGILLQFLIYPRINTRLGNVQCFRLFSILFPIAYTVAPFLAVIPPDSTSLTWIAITLVIAVHTTGRIFVLPATIVLLNNCAPDPSVLGMVHGVGQTTSALFRTLGPVVAGWVFGKSWEGGVIGAVWWGMAIVAVGGWVASLFVWERPVSRS